MAEKSKLFGVSDMEKCVHRKKHLDPRGHLVEYAAQPVYDDAAGSRVSGERDTCRVEHKVDEQAENDRESLARYEWLVDKSEILVFETLFGEHVHRQKVEY